MEQYGQNHHDGQDLDFYGHHPDHLVSQEDSQMAQQIDEGHLPQNEEGDALEEQLLQQDYLKQYFQNKLNNSSGSSLHFDDLPDAEAEDNAALAEKQMQFLQYQQQYQEEQEQLNGEEGSLEEDRQGINFNIQNYQRQQVYGYYQNELGGQATAENEPTGDIDAMKSQFDQFFTDFVNQKDELKKGINPNPVTKQYIDPSEEPEIQEAPAYGEGYHQQFLPHEQLVEEEDPGQLQFAHDYPGASGQEYALEQVHQQVHQQVHEQVPEQAHEQVYEQAHEQMEAQVEEQELQGQVMLEQEEECEEEELEPQVLESLEADEREEEDGEVQMPEHIYDGDFQDQNMMIQANLSPTDQVPQAEECMGGQYRQDQRPEVQQRERRYSSAQGEEILELTPPSEEENAHFDMNSQEFEDFVNQNIENGAPPEEQAQEEDHTLNLQEDTSALHGQLQQDLIKQYEIEASQIHHAQEQEEEHPSYEQLVAHCEGRQAPFNSENVPSVKSNRLQVFKQNLPVADDGRYSDDQLHDEMSYSQSVEKLNPVSQPPQQEVSKFSLGANGKISKGLKIQKKKDEPVLEQQPTLINEAPLTDDDDYIQKFRQQNLLKNIQKIQEYQAKRQKEKEDALKKPDQKQKTKQSSKAEIEQENQENTNITTNQGDTLISAVDWYQKPTRVARMDEQDQVASGSELEDSGEDTNQINIMIAGRGQHGEPSQEFFQNRGEEADRGEDELKEFSLSDPRNASKKLKNLRKKPPVPDTEVLSGRGGKGSSGSGQQRCKRMGMSKSSRQISNQNPERDGVRRAFSRREQTLKQSSTLAGAIQPQRRTINRTNLQAANTQQQKSNIEQERPRNISQQRVRPQTAKIPRQQSYTNNPTRQQQKLAISPTNGLAKQRTLHSQTGLSQTSQMQQQSSLMQGGKDIIGKYRTSHGSTVSGFVDKKQENLINEITMQLISNIDMKKVQSQGGSVANQQQLKETIEQAQKILSNISKMQSTSALQKQGVTSQKINQVSNVKTQRPQSSTMPGGAKTKTVSSTKASKPGVAMIPSLRQPKKPVAKKTKKSDPVSMYQNMQNQWEKQKQKQKQKQQIKNAQVPNRTTTTQQNFFPQQQLSAVSSQQLTAQSQPAILLPSSSMPISLPGPDQLAAAQMSMPATIPNQQQLNLLSQIVHQQQQFMQSQPMALDCGGPISIDVADVHDPTYGHLPAQIPKSLSSTNRNKPTTSQPQTRRESESEVRTKKKTGIVRNQTTKQFI